MKISVTGTTSREIERWNEHVRDSPQGLLYHRYEFLQLMAARSGFDLYPLRGHDENGTVGLFPVFRRSLGPASLVYSPPHGFHVPNLGPVLVENGSEEQDSQCRTDRFVAACLEWIETNLDPAFSAVKTSWEFTDPRPFRRAQFTVRPRFTYTLDLSREEDEIRKSFSRSLRRGLDPDVPVECRVPDDEVEALKYVVEQTRQRYAAQGKSYSMRPEFVEDLYERAPDGSLTPYVGYVDGERRSGIVVARDDETAHFWIGGNKTDAKVQLNDILHWRIIRDLSEEGLQSYDLVGANTPRLCDYKAKFNPDLQLYFELSRETLPVKAYRHLQSTLRAGL